MSIAELGALGEFIGSILVLGTLVYLVLQVRQTSRGINASNFVNATHMFNPVNLAIVEDAELFDLWLRGCNEPDTLSDVEAARFHLLLRSINNNFLALWLAYQDGTFPESSWRIYERNFGELLATPGGGALIESVRFATPEMAEAMELWREAAGGKMNWTRSGYQLVSDTTGG